MKKINLMMWQGLVLSALALGFASCEPETPCPNRKGAETNTDQGVTVMLEMENVETGETTRTALGEDGYSFTAKDGGGDVQAGGLGFYPKSVEGNEINVALTYYAKENVVFQGWSWRYSEDPVGTHRGKDDAKINDYVATPALQSERGVQKLNLSDDATMFTCQYRPGTDNRVYVKVKYKQLRPEDIVRTKVNLSPIFIPRANMNKDLIGCTWDRYPGDKNIDYNKIELPLLSTTTIREYDYVSPTQSFIGKQENTYSEFVIDCAMEQPSILDGVPSNLRKFQVKMKISGVVTPIARFVYEYEDGSTRDRFVCYRKILSERHKFDNLSIGLTMPAEHHGGYISSWTEYDGRTMILGLAGLSLYNAAVNKEELQVRESYARTYGLKGFPMDYKCWYLANKGDWRITEATIEPIIYGDKVYMFDCTTY